MRRQDIRHPQVKAGKLIRHNLSDIDIKDTGRAADRRDFVFPGYSQIKQVALHRSVPASDCPDLTALSASKRSVVDEDRFGALTGYDTRREVYGAPRHLDPLPGTAGQPGARVRRHHLDQGRQETR